MARVSIITDDLTHCALCGSSISLQLHHCLHGPYRKQADKDKLTVMLCQTCHMNLHDHGWYDNELKAVAQKAYMTHHNATEDDFRKRYGKSWLTE